MAVFKDFCLSYDPLLLSMCKTISKIASRKIEIVKYKKRVSHTKLLDTHDRARCES